MSKNKDVVKVHDPEVVTAETMGATDLTMPMHERASACRKRIDDARCQATVASFQLALGIMEAVENNYAALWGYANFEEFAEKDLKMGLRRAYYHADVGRAIRAAKLVESDVEKVGWTKMKEIAKAIIAKPEEAPRLIALATNLTTKSLIAQLQAEQERVTITSGSAGTPSVMRLDLKFDTDAMEFMSKAIKDVGAEIGSDNHSLCIQHIVSEWSMARGASAEAATLDTWLKHLERAFGVKLQRVESNESIEAVLGESADEDAEQLNVGLASVDKDLNDLLGTMTQ